MVDRTEGPDVRWKQRLDSFQRAFAQLSAGAQLAKTRPLSDLEQQGLIQAFEFTHELAWKTLRDYLENQGESEIHGSKDAVRKAFARGLLTDGEVWMKMIQSRNRSSHTYNEQTAAEIAGAISHSYLPAFEEFKRYFLELATATP